MHPSYVIIVAKYNILQFSIVISKKIFLEMFKDV